MSIETKLTELGLELPQPPKPIAAYVPAVRTGNLIIVSGQLPLKNGELMSIGPVQNIEDAQKAAAQCVLNGLAIIKDQLDGDWTKLKRIVRVGVFVQCEDGFTDQPKVANGASELLQELLGEAGRHARAAVGVNALPLNATVEIEFMVEVTD